MPALTSRMAEFHARPDDRELFTQWAFNTPTNLFDPKVMFYPTTNTVAVEREGSCIFFGPFQAVVMLESLAPKPGLSPREMAAALSKFHEGIVNICRAQNIREIYFICADERVAEFTLHHPILVEGKKTQYTEINGEMVQWAKDRGYQGPVKRTLKLKLHGPEDNLEMGDLPMAI